MDCSPRPATALVARDGTRQMVIDHAKCVYWVSQQPVFTLNTMRVL